MNATSISNNVIEDYIQRVSELNQSIRRIPTSEELEKIAVDLGISDEEIRAAQKQSQDNFIRAKSYCSLSHWDDAIAELQEALIFNPGNLEMLTCLATAYMGRWQKLHRPEDEKNIRDTIRKCLTIQPDHEESLFLLSELDRALETKRQQTSILVGASLGIIVAGIGFGSLLVLNNPLSRLFNKEPSAVEQLKLQMVEEITTLRQTQEEMRMELYSLQNVLAEQTHQDRFSRSDMVELEKRAKRLEKSLRIMQDRLLILERGESIQSPMFNHGEYRDRE
jgi:tetratricopeptide (TPR) repeat protein